MLFPVDAQDDLICFHCFEDIATDPLIHRNPVLGVRSAMRRVVFAGPEQARFSSVLDHPGGGVPGEVKRDDEFPEGIGPGSEEVSPVTFDRPRVFRFGTGDPRNRGASVRHREGPSTSHCEMVYEVGAHMLALAKVSVEVVPFRERDLHGSEFFDPEVRGIRQWVQGNLISGPLTE